jgi:hypothetical protein
MMRYALGKPYSPNGVEVEFSEVRWTLKRGGCPGRLEVMSDVAKGAPVVSVHQVVGAGVAAATAAFVTSRFGVAGTLLGAALTAMIITGGSAILKSYLESVTGNARKAPIKLRARRNRRKAGRSTEPPETLPTRPDLGENFAGRMRAALDWFSHLPLLTRRSILLKGLIAAAVAFVIGIGAVWAVEKGIGNSLSCGIWSNCPEGARPGIHLGGGDGTGADSTLSWGRAKTKEVAPGREVQGPAYERSPLRQQGPSSQRQEPGYQQQPAQPDARPGGGILQPDKPAAQSAVRAQQDQPSSASPAPQEEQAPPGGAAGDPAQQGTPSTASPTAPSQ